MKIYNIVFAYCIRISPADHEISNEDEGSIGQDRRARERAIDRDGGKREERKERDRKGSSTAACFPRAQLPRGLVKSAPATRSCFPRALCAIEDTVRRCLATAIFFNEDLNSLSRRP